MNYLLLIILGIERKRIRNKISYMIKNKVTNRSKSYLKYHCIRRLISILNTENKNKS
jgi:hypothetical protein